MTPHPEVRREAREWFVRLLDDDVSVKEIAEWEAWLARSEAHRQAYDLAAEAWAAAGAAVAPRASAQELRDDAYDGSAPVAAWRPAAARRAWAPTAIAATLALAVLSATALVGLRHAPEGQAITTTRAEHRNARLADGSEVAVGAMTGVQVRFDERRREIRLDAGEAYFHVAKDRERPFVVETPLGAVTAVGTAFNVDVGDDQMSLNVTEGVVVVQPYGRALPPGLRAIGSRAVRVHAGQRLVLDGGGLVTDAKVDAAPTGVTWTQGRLEYRQEPLSAVIEDVNRYAAQPIVLRDPILATLSYTGTVRLDAVDDWAAALPAAFPLSVAQADEGVVVLSAKR